jgi:hypothetical protein
MLNLPIAMNQKTLLVLFFANLILPFWTIGSTVLFPRITSPQSGNTLQGMVNITGSTNSENLDYATISFAYEESESQTWFEIQEIRETVQDGTLAVWDTTTITDGTYSLRLEVFLKNGQHQEDVINGLKIRNYTPIETNTPRATNEVGQATEAVLASEIEAPTQTSPTPLPGNPAEITPGSIRESILTGSLLATLGLIILAIYGWVRTKSSK